MGNSVGVAGASANSSLSRLSQQLLQRLEQQQPLTEEQRQRLADYPFLQAVGCLDSTRWSSSLVCISPSEGLVFCKLHASPLTGGILSGVASSLRGPEPDSRLTQQTQLLQKAAMSFDIHPNLLPVDRVLVTEQSVCTVRPFLSRSLPELQQDQLALSLDSRVSKLFVSFQLVCGAVQLHSLGFFHGNICPQNVLLDPSGFAFLSDAASSRCCVQVSQKEVFEASAAGLQALEVAPPGALRLAPEMFGFFDSGTAAGNGCSEAKSEVEAFQQQDVFALACLLAEVFADGGEVMDLLSLLQLKRRLLAKRKDLRRRGRRCPAQNSAEISAECGREAFSMKEEDSDCSSCKHSSEREIQQALFQKLKFLASSELNLEVSRCSQVPTVIFQRLVQAVPCKRFLSALLFGVFLRQPEERLTASQFLKALERSVFPPCFFGFLLCLRVLLLHPVYQQPDLRLQLLLRYLPQLVASLLATRVEDSAADAGALRSGEEDQSRTLRLLAAAARRALPEEDSSVVFQSLLTLTETLPSELCFTKQLFDAWTNSAASLALRAARVASFSFSASATSANAEAASAAAAAAAASRASFPHPRLSLVGSRLFAERLFALWDFCREGCVAKGRPVLQVLSSLEEKKVEMFDGLFDSAGPLKSPSENAAVSALGAYSLPPSRLIERLLAENSDAPGLASDGGGEDRCVGCLRTDLVGIPGAVIGVSVQRASSARLRIGGLHAVAFLCRFASTTALVQELVPALIKGMEDPTAQVRAASVSLLPCALVHLEKSIFHDRRCQAAVSRCPLCLAPSCGVSLLEFAKTQKTGGGGFSAEADRSTRSCAAPDVVLLFSDLIAPALERLGSDTSASVRNSVAASLPRILQVVRRCAVVVETAPPVEGSPCEESRFHRSEEGSTKEGNENEKRNFFSEQGVVVEEGQSLRLRRLHSAAQNLLRRLLTSSRPDELLPLLQTQHLARVAWFLGGSNVQRFLLPHLTVLLNGRDSALRAAVARALGSLGGELAGRLRSVEVECTDSWLLPCLEQCLSDPAEEVATAAASALCELSCGGFLDIANRRLLNLLRRRVVPLLLGPSRLVRAALLQLLAALERSAPQEKVFALLVPLLKPVLRSSSSPRRRPALSMGEAASRLRPPISCSLWQRLLCLERHSPLASALSSPEALKAAERALRGLGGLRHGGDASAGAGDSSDDDEEPSEGCVLSAREETWNLWRPVLRALGNFEAVEGCVCNRVAQEETRDDEDCAAAAPPRASDLDFFAVAETAASCHPYAEGLSLELRSLLRLLRGLNAASQFALLLLLGPLAAQRAAAARGCLSLCPRDANLSESFREAAFASALQSCDLLKGSSPSPLCCSVDSVAECCLLEEFSPLVRLDGFGGESRREALRFFEAPVQHQASLSSVWQEALMPLCLSLAFHHRKYPTKDNGASSTFTEDFLDGRVAVAAEAASAVAAISAAQFELNRRPPPPLLFAMLGVEFSEGPCMASVVHSQGGRLCVPFEAFASVINAACAAAARVVCDGDLAEDGPELATEGEDVSTPVADAPGVAVSSVLCSSSSSSSRNSRGAKGALLVPQALSRDFRCALLGLPSKFSLVFLPAPQKRSEGTGASLGGSGEGALQMAATSAVSRRSFVGEEGSGNVASFRPHVREASAASGKPGGEASLSRGKTRVEGLGAFGRDASGRDASAAAESRREARTGTGSLNRFEDWRPRGQWLLNLNEIKAHCSGVGGKLLLLGVDESLLFAAPAFHPKAAAALWRCDDVCKGLRRECQHAESESESESESLVCFPFVVCRCAAPLVAWWVLPNTLQLTAALALGGRAVALATSEGTLHVLQLDASSTALTRGGGSSSSSSASTGTWAARVSGTASVPGALLRVKTPRLQVAPVAASPLAVLAMQREALALRQRAGGASSRRRTPGRGLHFAALASESVRLSKLFLRPPSTQAGSAALAATAAASAAASLSASSAVESLASASSPFQDELFFLQQSGLFGSWDLRTGGGSGDFGGFVFPPWFGAPSALAVHPRSFWAVVGTASGVLVLLDLRMRQPLRLWKVRPASAVKQLLVVDSAVAAAARSPVEALMAAALSSEGEGGPVASFAASGGTRPQGFLDALSVCQRRLCCCVLALVHGGAETPPLLLVDVLGGHVLSAYNPSCFAAQSFGKGPGVPRLEAVRFEALWLPSAFNECEEEAAWGFPPFAADTAHAPLCLWRPPSLLASCEESGPCPFFLSAGEDRVVRYWNVAEFAAVGASLQTDVCCAAQDSQRGQQHQRPDREGASRARLLDSSLVKSYAVCGPSSLCGCRSGEQSTVLPLLCETLPRQPTAACLPSGGEGAVRVFHEACEHSCAFRRLLCRQTNPSRRENSAEKGKDAGCAECRSPGRRVPISVKPLAACTRRSAGGEEDEESSAVTEIGERCGLGAECCGCSCACLGLHSARDKNAHRLTPGSWAPLWVSGQSTETPGEGGARGGDITSFDSGPSVHHRDAIVCLAGVAGEVNLLASAGRDNVVKLWI